MEKVLPKVTIIGAGLVGSLLSCYLSKRGHQVKVFERRPDLRAQKIDGNKSINLAMSTRGWTALERVGLKDRLMPIAIPMFGRKIHQTDRTIDFQPYGKDNEAIYSISRGELNKVLLEEADKDPNVQLNFNEKCEDIDFDSNKMTFINTLRNRTSQLQTDVIFGCDGAFSGVRYNMQKTPMFNYSQEYLPHGYKELTIPAKKDGTHALDKNALHIWPRKSFMMIALPNLDGSFTVTLFAPFKGENSFESIKTDNDILKFFSIHFPTAIDYMPSLLEDYNSNPTAGLVTIRCNPWYFKNACLVGDASHAVVPFYGQGMNAGFEDCRILDEIIGEEDGGWHNIISKFSKKRMPDANAIADLAIRNFVEMSDSTADDTFLNRKKLEQFLTDKYPNRFVSQYRMVTFTNKPYSTALTLGDKQIQFLEKLLEKYPKKEDWKNEEMLSKVEAWLEENS